MKLDLEKIKVSTPSNVKITQVISTIKVGKPPKTSFFWTRSGEGWELPEIDTYTRKGEENKDSTPYLVTDEDCKAYLRELNVLVPVKFYMYVLAGSKILKLDMIPQNLDKTGKLNDWHRTRMEAYELAKTKWVRMYSTEGGFYQYAYTEDLWPDPVWSKKPETLLEALEIAFKGYIIENMDHPEIKRLRGKL